MLRPKGQQHRQKERGRNEDQGVRKHVLEINSIHFLIGTVIPRWAEPTVATSPRPGLVLSRLLGRSPLPRGESKRRALRVEDGVSLQYEDEHAHTRTRTRADAHACREQIYGDKRNMLFKICLCVCVYVFVWRLRVRVRECVRPPGA